MLRCLLLDDEQAALEILKIHMEKAPFLTLTWSTTNPIEALNILHSTKIDLVFLDIHMPEITGLEFIKAIPSGVMAIITTAYSEYALDGYDLNIVDYLMKPISLQRFLRASSKAWKMYSIESSPDTLPYNDGDHIFVKTEYKGKLVKVKFNDIKYIEGMKNYVAIHRGQEKFLTLNSLSEMEKILPPNKFIRIHKSYIVSIEEIESIDGGHVLLRHSDVQLPFGITYKDAFMERIRTKLL
jgi:two-component system LytT family response regulator